MSDTSVLFAYDKALLEEIEAVEAALHGGVKDWETYRELIGKRQAHLQDRQMLRDVLARFQHEDADDFDSE